MARITFTWNQHWPTTIFVAVLLPCLLTLGQWQLHRAEEKRAMQAQFAQLRQHLPLTGAQLSGGLPSYTPVAVSGHFDNEHNLLLDNRVSRGRFGYEVLTPFVADDNSTQMMVNRGWIEGDSARQSLPQIPPVPGLIIVHGYVYRDGVNRLSGIELETKQWPRLVEQIDLERMQSWLAVPLYPFTLRLNAESIGALRADWPIVAVDPERHVGYAVQWFAMAFTLCVLWLVRSSNVREVIFGADKDD